jgi:branched-chain amino acid aminotransferase
MHAQPALPNGVFETFRLWNGEPVAWHLHRERLLGGAALLGATLPDSLFDAAFREIAYKWEALGQPEHARARLKVRCVPAIAVALEVTPLHHSLLQAPSETLNIGLIETDHLLETPYCWYKTLERTAYNAAQAWAEANGFDDALLLHNGYVADSARSNVIIVNQHEQAIVPPPESRRLPGTALKRVIAGLNTLGYSVTETPITVAELQQARIVLLTNAIRGVEHVRTVGTTELRYTASDAEWVNAVRVASFA